MSKMGDAVHRRVEAIRCHHERMKGKKYGWLVRPLTLVGGWLMVVVGAITIPFPGPGWFIVFLGIGVLSLELEWPSRLLDWSIRKYDQFEEWWARQTTPVQFMLGGLTVLVVGALLLMLFVLGWNLGVLNWTKGWLQPWIEKLPNDIPERLGLEL